MLASMSRRARHGNLLMLSLTHMRGAASSTTAEASCSEDTTGKNMPWELKNLAEHPLQYLALQLEPQGMHKLWRDGVDIGAPQVSTELFEPGNTLGSGVWECTPGSWTITRSNTESFLVLRGRATLTNSDGSIRVVLYPGVWHTTPAGWSGRWVVKQTVRKLFVLTP